MMAIWIVVGLFSAGYIGYVAGSRPWQAKYNRVRKAAQNAMQVLGPDAPSGKDCENDCRGCLYEMQAAIDYLREGGIEYKFLRKRKHGPDQVSDPTSEHVDHGSGHGPEGAGGDTGGILRPSGTPGRSH